IARTHDVWPAQFIHTESNRPLGEIQSPHKHTHRHCRRMPAACNQAFENGSLGALAGEMKHLRIKFVRELDHLLLRHLQLLGFKAVAHLQIIEVMLFHSYEWQSYIHEPLLRIEQRVKCSHSTRGRFAQW